MAGTTARHVATLGAGTLSVATRSLLAVGAFNESPLPAVGALNERPLLAVGALNHTRFPHCDMS